MGVRAWWYARGASHARARCTNRPDEGRIRHRGAGRAGAPRGTGSTDVLARVPAAHTRHTGSLIQASSAPSTLSGARAVLRSQDVDIVVFLPCDHFGSFPADFEGPLGTHPYPSYHTYDTDEEVVEEGGSLVNLDGHGVHVESEEDAWDSLAVFDYFGVMRDAVLVRLD